MDPREPPISNVDHCVGAVNPVSNKVNLQLVTRIVWTVVRRHWLALSMGLVTALVVGGMTLKPLSKNVWRAAGLLLYTPPTVPKQVHAMESSLQLANMSGFATSRPVLHRVKDDLGLEFPIDLIEKKLLVETSRNTSTIFMAIDWGDREEAIEILEQLMVVYPQYVAEVRQKIATNMLNEVEQQAETIKARLVAARSRYRDFTRANSIVNFKQDLILMQTRALELKTKLSQLKRNEESMRDQITILNEHLKSIRVQEKSEKKARKEFRAAQESLADNRRRQNRLRELIEEERRVQEIRGQIAVKQREYERSKLLAEKRLIPRSQLEKVRGSLEALIAKIAENERITAWKQELLDLDEMIVPKDNAALKGSPIISQILLKKLEAELDIAHAQKEQLELEQELASAQTQISTYQHVRGELAALEDDIETASLERRQLEEKATILRQFADQGPTEFSIASPVSTGDYPVKSNRKRVFAGVVLAVMMLVGASVLSYDVMLYGIIPAEIQLELLGVPVIGRSMVTPAHSSENPSHQQPYTDSIRSLALQIRQLMSNAGSVVMFSSLSSPQLFSQLIVDLARCFANRDERVLILDARFADDGLGDLADLVDVSELVEQVSSKSTSAPHEDPIDRCLPGLRDWLSFECDSISEIIHPTNLAAIDCILPGCGRPGEELATIRMSSLVDEVRRRFSLILLVGPGTEPTKSTDLQILAAHADGVTLAYEHDRRMDTTSSEPIRSLLNVGAPLLGAVEL